MTTENEELLTERGLERRLKRHFLKASHTFFATCTPGFEKILLREIQLLGSVENCVVDTGGVEFTGSLDLMYLANLNLRSANRISMRVSSFTVRSYPELFNKVQRIPWEHYIGFSKKYSITATAKESRLHHTGNIEKAVHEGMVEVLEPLGLKPRKVDKAEVSFFVRFSGDTCTISIDTTGELLYKRGYKINTAFAPVRESIASALLIESEVQKYPVVADPMCGSGTFIIEAALIGINSAPGANRLFAFMHWPSFTEGKWERLRKASLDNRKQKTEVRYVGSDINDAAVEAVKENCKRAGVEKLVTCNKADCLDFNTDVAYGRKGLIISNLPYGKRVGEITELRSFLKKLGRHLQKHCKGWNFGFITADTQFLKYTNLKGTVALRFDNGGIPVEFVMGMVE